MFELVKRDGSREEYDCAKLAQSLTRAGVAPHMLAGILDRVAPNRDLDTISLRALVESELALRQPSAARRYAFTCSLAARGSERAGYGWVCASPETVNRLNLRPGDTVWLNYDGVAAPFSIESLAHVERGQAWLNSREMTAMGIHPGTRLAASSVYQVISSSSEESEDSGRTCVTGAVRNGRR